MPRRYVGPHDTAYLAHPITGAPVHFERGQLVPELDDLDDAIDLGAEWETVPAPARKTQAAPAAAPSKEGDA